MDQNIPEWNPILKTLENQCVSVTTDNDAVKLFLGGDHRLVIHTSFGENFPMWSIIKRLKTKFPNAYHIIISQIDYRDDIDDSFHGEFIWQPTGYAATMARIYQFSGLNKSCKVNKHFLSLNNVARPIRHSLWQFMVKTGILQKSDMSYIFKNQERNKDTQQLWHSLQASIGSRWFNEGIDWEEARRMLPLGLDGYDGIAVFPTDSHLYNSTFMSIVTETCSLRFMTEKTLKPLAYGHPLLLLNLSKGLAMLKNIGFKTFADFIDESYDDLHGEDHRDAVFREIIRLSGLSIDDINDLRQQHWHTIEHNHWNFWHEIPAKDDLFLKEYVIPKITDKMDELGIDVKINNSR